MQINALPTSIHFVVLNLDTLLDVVSSRFIIFWYPIFILYLKNLSSSIICWRFSEGMCMQVSYILFTSLYSSFPIFFDLPAEIILSTILFPITFSVASTVFWTTVFLMQSLQYLFLFLLQHPLIFHHIYNRIFLQMTKTNVLQYFFYILVLLNISFMISIWLLRSY